MRRTLVIVFVSVFALGLVACSDDDSSDAQDVSGVEANDSDENSDESSDSAEPSGDPKEFCNRVLAAEEASPDDESLADALAQIESLREVAPNQEIDDALGAYADLFTKMAELDTASDGDPENSDNPIGDVLEGPYLEMLEIMFDPEFLQASVTLTEYFATECGSDFGLGELGGLEDALGQN